MKRLRQFYIEGKWQDAGNREVMDVVNPATDETIDQLALATPADVETAIEAAHKAFASYATSTKKEKIGLLKSILQEYERRREELAQALTQEMGAPISLARKAQTELGVQHFKATLSALETYDFEQPIGNSRILREPIGVCSLITPWNWPLNQITCKIAPALAAGCCVVLKPSEYTPLSASVFAEIMDAAGCPAGVFNMVFGKGEEVGPTLNSHRLVDMVSLTGSTRAGIAVATQAAQTVKRVSQELGGKSPALVLRDADLNKAVRSVASDCFQNSGQSCNAPTRLLIPKELVEKAAAIACEVARGLVIGNPSNPETTLGPLAHKAQFEKVQHLIRVGIQEGAKLEFGGEGRPDGISKGCFVKPTVFSQVKPTMTIAQEEIFGPVVSIISYDSEEEALEIANNTIYGLSGYVFSADRDKALSLARKIRAGMIHINGAALDFAAPFGGYKMSGNGREWGRFGLEEFLEIKSILG
ncbi:MAG: aldehyde dehydrogenase family protein [Verrucomicrobia bacterium]|nr:MAG: aldehyde dehydrogenase family protein [Verrucomicrobiota bacterium]